MVWLLNRTMMKPVEGMTPYEAAFGKKPNLKGVREWGENVYVRVEKGTKLGGHVREAKWLGMDEESKGVRVYWPDTRSVTVEHNIYFNNSSARRVEEEDDVEVIKTTTDLPVVGNPSITQAQTPDDPEASDADMSGQKHTHKCTKKIADLLKGEGSWGTASKPTLAPGVQQPTQAPAVVQLDDWTASVSMCEDEYAFVAETSSAEE